MCQVIYWTLPWVIWMRSTPLHITALFGHTDYCQSKRIPETLQPSLLSYEVNHLEMDMSPNLLYTAMGSFDAVNSTS